MDVDADADPDMDRCAVSGVLGSQLTEEEDGLERGGVLCL